MSETLSRLSTLLRDEKESLIQRWTELLREDASIPHAHPLDETELRDHIPMMIDQLVESLAQTARGDAEGATGLEIANTEGAKQHARHRMEHHYELAEEMRELAHLRSVLLAVCGSGGVTLEGHDGQLLHGLLDQLMITAAVELEHGTTAALHHDVETRELFAAVLGHDLRSPLGVITLAATGLQHHMEGLRRDQLRVISSAAQMKGLIEDLLDMARIRAHGGHLPADRKPCDLKVICENTIVDLQRAEHGHPIELSAGGSMQGEWDPDRLRQLLTNLLSNALDYSSPDHPVRVELHDHGPAVELAVHNAGPRIPERQLATIFDPFSHHESGDRPSKGLGLGLFIAREIVEGHGGTIRVDSRPEEGTTFTVSLPRAA